MFNKKPKTHPEYEKYQDAVKLVYGLLERAEARIVEVRKSCRIHEFDPSFDRDRFHYLVGRADSMREILMCMGEFGL
jgi:hypothetical protein